jgi:hypothetical protein
MSRPPRGSKQIDRAPCPCKHPMLPTWQTTGLSHRHFEADAQVEEGVLTLM